MAIPPPKNQIVNETQQHLEHHATEIVIAGVVGNIIEWYDFALFGYFAPLLSTLFFPNTNDVISLLQTYGVFAAGFIMRPLGAILFGYIGDRVDRRTELFLSVILMAIPTFLLGLLPDYEHIGLAAPIILTILRLIQGLSVGGEFTGSVTYVAETAPQDRRGLTASFANVGSILGVLTGLGMVTLMASILPDSSLHTWGWRLPFLLGGILGLVGFYLRRDIPESEIFQEHHQSANVPLWIALKNNIVVILQATLYSSGYGVIFYILLVYLPTYLSKFTEVSLGDALWINTVATFVLLLVIPLTGWLSDRNLRRKFWLIIAMISFVLSGYPAFLLLQQGSIILIWLVQIWFAVLIGIIAGVSPAMMVELFPTESRLTSYSIAFNLGVGFLGGTSPLVATWLIEATGSIYIPAFYVVGAAFVAMLGLGFMTDRSREPLI